MEKEEEEVGNEEEVREAVDVGGKAGVESFEVG